MQYMIYTYNLNKNVDIKFSAHHTFLDSPSLGTLKAKRLGRQIC